MMRDHGEISLGQKDKLLHAYESQLTHNRYVICDHIPVIFYNTDVHPDYHRPSDVAEKINPEKLARIARLAFLVAWKVANLEPAPTYHPLKITH
ncbi:M28 family peptidase [candidate division KSB1 bacterium]|nr:M28 family peptidase [candidate division KSB1 bacterium]